MWRYVSNVKFPLNECRLVTVDVKDALEFESHDYISAQEGAEPVDEVAVDAKGLPGWDRVDKMAEALIALEGLFVTNAQAEVVKELYHNLLDYDKEPLKYPPMHQTHSTHGRFARKYRSGHVGVESMKR